jgi:hypothetical protein
MRRDKKKNSNNNKNNASTSDEKQPDCYFVTSSDMINNSPMTNNNSTPKPKRNNKSTKKSRKSLSKSKKQKQKKQQQPSTEIPKNQPQPHSAPVRITNGKHSMQLRTICPRKRSYSDTDDPCSPMESKRSRALKSPTFPPTKPLKEIDIQAKQSIIAAPVRRSTRISTSPLAYNRNTLDSNLPQEGIVGCKRPREESDLTFTRKKLTQIEEELAIVDALILKKQTIEQFDDDSSNLGNSSDQLDSSETEVNEEEFPLIEENNNPTHWTIVKQSSPTTEKTTSTPLQSPKRNVIVLRQLPS